MFDKIYDFLKSLGYDMNYVNNVSIDFSDKRIYIYSYVSSGYVLDEPVTTYHEHDHCSFEYFEQWLKETGVIK